MNRALAFCLLLASSLPLTAQVIRVPAPVEPSEDEAPAKPPALNWRATQINRCADGRGGVKLQDLPCSTAETVAASAPADVAELSSLPPRPLPDAATAAQAPPSSRADFLVHGLLHGAWKLALLLAAGYLLFRGIRALRAHLDFKHAFEEHQARGPRRSR